MNNESIIKIQMENPISDSSDDTYHELEIEILPPVDVADARELEIYNNISEIDARLDAIASRVEELNSELDSLTNHADGLDYLVAAASGIVAGLIDSFFVGETEIDKEKIEKMLAEKYHVANDNAFTHKTEGGPNVSSPLYHRLDDLAHHPTPAGLVASILVRYFRLVIFIDGTDGKPHIFFADKSKNEATRKLEKDQLMKAWIGAILSGICMWLANVAETKCEEEFDGELPEGLAKLIKMVGHAPLIIEIFKATDNWVGHIMSDVSTSQGIPGIFLSLLKEISVLPVIRDTNFRVYVDGLYNKGENNFSEWGGVAFVAAKKQSMPVLINEALVRGFYFVRNLISEYQKNGSFKSVNWDKVIPFGNRTVERMITISMGTFVAMDIADAAIRSGGFNANCILRINFVGIGRFAVAIGTDVGMGIKSNKKDAELQGLRGQQLELLNAKIFYKDAAMWHEAKSTEDAINEAYVAMKKTEALFSKTWEEIKTGSKSRGDHVNVIRENNSSFADELSELLEWGI